MGGQISASILTAGAAVGQLPGESAFVDAFWLAAAMLALGFAATLLVPRRRPLSATAREPSLEPV
jgi:hypothetical protein